MIYKKVQLKYLCLSWYYHFDNQNTNLTIKIIEIGINGDVCNYLKERTESTYANEEIKHVEDADLVVAAR